MTATPESERNLVERLTEVAETPYAHSKESLADKIMIAAAAIERLAEELDTAQAECLEQARLLDMSATREAKMMAERDEAQRVIRERLAVECRCEELIAERDSLKQKCERRDEELGVYVLQVEKLREERDALLFDVETARTALRCESGARKAEVAALRERAEAIDALEAWIKRDTIGPQTRALIAVRRFNDTGTIDFDAENPWTVKRIGGRGTTLHEAIRAALEQAEPGSTT
jgi:chromosome segregation ATPase